MDTDLNIPDMGEADYLAGLLLKQLRQQITENELQFLENWKAGHPAHAAVSERVNNEEQLLADLLAMKQVDMEGWWQKISAQVEPVRQPVPLYRRWYVYAAAAAVLLIAGVAAWRYWPADKQALSVTEKQKPSPVTVLPGGNKASLTLSNGGVINLVDAVDGKVAEDGNSRIIKTKDGELKYEAANDNPPLTAVAMNILSTPRGGQYQLVLPDGSKVWLNAASSITYPTQFSANERQVTITGEAYFEVTEAPQNAGKEKLPFIVTVQSPAGRKLAQVDVVGTKFNIMAYADEASIKTTLLKGKVKVAPAAAPGKNGNPRLLTPGQQAQIPQTAGAVANDSIRVIHMEDMETAFGWTNGFIPLKNSDLPSIMRALSRWYDIEVVYQGKIPDYKFGGSIPRTENFSSVLKILEYQGVHCKLQQNKLIVLP